MTSRERVAAALEHREPDRVPLDIGATTVTGISAWALYRLRVALGLSAEGEPVRVTEPYQLLGEVTDDLREALGIDTQGMGGSKTLFAGEPRLAAMDPPDGTPVLVPAASTPANPTGRCFNTGATALVSPAPVRRRVQMRTSAPAAAG